MAEIVKKVSARDIDAASALVRGLSAGKASVVACGDALKGMSPEELELVSLSTRVPVSRLRTLVAYSAAQGKLPV